MHLLSVLRIPHIAEFGAPGAALLYAVTHVTSPASYVGSWLTVVVVVVEEVVVASGAVCAKAKASKAASKASRAIAMAALQQE